MTDENETLGLTLITLIHLFKKGQHEDAIKVIKKLSRETRQHLREMAIYIVEEMDIQESDK